MTSEPLSPRAQQIWDEMREFVRENTERLFKSGWTKEDARERSINFLEGLMDGELTDEARELL